MGIPNKIDPEEMMRMVKDGRTDSEIARRFDVTPMAVNYRKRTIIKHLTAIPDVQKSELSRHNIDTVNQLRTMNDHIIAEMKRCQRLITREDDVVLKREKLEDQVKRHPEDTELAKKLRDMAGGNFNNILKIQDNIIKISGEVRKQIELQVKIYETIFNVQMVSEFQEEIIEILRQVEPELKDMIIKKLRERRSLRGLVQLDK